MNTSKPSREDLDRAIEILRGLTPDRVQELLDIWEQENEEQLEELRVTEVDSDD